VSSFRKLGSGQHQDLRTPTFDPRASCRIVATPEDYEAVRELVHDLIAEGVGTSVPPNIRQTVLAVKRLKPKHQAGVPLPALAAELRLDKSSTSRRVSDAIERGFLRNEQEKQGQPARLFAGEPLPEEVEVLPRLEAIPDERCTVARCSRVEEEARASHCVGAGPVLSESRVLPEERVA
jgi:hypothetical protein